jgi:alpha-tubulin suppressor-like RCC1 family protein
MAPQPENRRRKTAGLITSVIVAVALVAAGTWAWYDFTQTYRNAIHGKSKTDYDPILIDEFIDDDRTYDNWRVDETLPKLIYVTYDHTDPLYESYGGHIEDDGVLSGEPPCEDMFKPTWIRVNLTETVTIYDSNTGITETEGPTIYTGTQSDRVEWGLGPNIIAIDDWLYDWEHNPFTKTGPFWVLDTDGWMYWAQPLEHGQTTTPILEDVTLLALDDAEEIDYYIDIHLEAIDRGLRDLDKWVDPDESTNPVMSLAITPLLQPRYFGRNPDGTTMALAMPAGTSSNTGATDHTIFLDGINLYAAGYNNSGQLSDGTITDRSAPVPMKWDPTTPMTLNNVKEIRQSQYNTYLQKPDGTWWAVGRNSEGELSVGTSGVGTNAFYPVPMMWDPTTPITASNLKDLRPTYTSLYLLRDDGKWYGLGNNSQGQLSNGDTTLRSYPAVMEWAAGQPIYQGDLTQLINNDTTLFLLKKADNVWYGVGQNSWGELSIGSTGAKSYPVAMSWDNTPTPITGDNTILHKGVGVGTVIVRPDGTYWGVGRNTFNGLSDGTTTDRNYPVPMHWAAGEPMTTSNVQQFIGSYSHWFALKSDNIWYAQGINNDGELSRGASESTGAVNRYPEPAEWANSVPMTSSNVKTIQALNNYTQIQKPDGSWWAVGNGGNSQLVDGTTTNKSYPVPMLWANGDPIGLPH